MKQAIRNGYTFSFFSSEPKWTNHKPQIANWSFIQSFSLVTKTNNNDVVGQWKSKTCEINKFLLVNHKTQKKFVFLD